MMFDRRFLQCFDWILLSLTVVLAVAGAGTLYSAVTAGSLNAQKLLYLKQITWFGIGFFIMSLLLVINYKTLEQWSYVIYIFCMILLIWVLLYGRYGGGAKRWLMIGSVSIGQPSELVKIAIIIVLARCYSRSADTRGITLKEMIQPIILVAFPFILVVKQPDLGTAMLILLIAGSITVFVKIERRSLVMIVISFLVAIPAVWVSLKGYQRQRILTFFDPERDPLGAGYHIIQSKISIGSGMVWGKGFLHGTQNALSFLPEQHTDFIFSVLAEEWGFVGSAAVLFLFLMLIFRGLTVAQNCRDPFGTIVSVGATAMIFWQAFINLGMVMGLMPVVGVPLPFISYGGSSVLTIMICVALLMNISMRRFIFE